MQHKPKKNYMPILIQVSEGLLSPEGERKVLPRMAELFLRLHGLAGNSFMTPNVIGHVEVFPLGCNYAGGSAQSLAVVELKVPAVTFPTQEIKAAFVREATDLIDELKAGTHPRERTFVNVVHAVDGIWGIGGKAYTNEELGQAIQGGSNCGCGA